ncbi:hypothetical protein, partial [Desulfothermus okinawensis]
NRQELTDKKLSKFKSHRIPIVEYMLTKEGIHNLVTERDNKKRHIIRAVYEDNDILRKEGGIDVVTKPRKQLKPQMYSLWEEIESFIIQEKPESFKALIIKLLSTRACNIICVNPFFSLNTIELHF